MFRALVTATLLAAGLVLSAAPASAQYWGDQSASDRDPSERQGWDQDQGEHHNWERERNAAARWGRVDGEEESWGDERGHHGRRHHWREGEDWGRDGHDDDGSF
jgi:hypothetical protein